MNHTWTGIHLAQSGKRAEALAHLRQAIQYETPNAEVWLWLAHVTPELEEYRYCVAQALTLDPGHVIARQMQAILTQLYTTPPQQTQSLVVDPALVASMERQHRTRRQRRFFITLLLMALLGGLGAVGALVLSTQDDAETTPTIHTLEFTTSTNLTWRFEVQIPDSWLLADENSSEWLGVRDQLPDDIVMTEADLSSISVDASNGDVSPPPTIVDTQFTDNPLWLQLAYIKNVGAQIDTCEDMQQWADQTALSGSVLESEVVQQDGEQCIFMVHFRDTSPNSGLIEHKYVLHVPIGATTIAEWHLTTTDDQHEWYADDIQQVIETLHAIKS